MLVSREKFSQPSQTRFGKNKPGHGVFTVLKGWGLHSELAGEKRVFFLLFNLSFTYVDNAGHGIYANIINLRPHYAIANEGKKWGGFFPCVVHFDTGGIFGHHHHHRLPIDFDEGCFKLDLWDVFSSNHQQNAHAKV